MTARIRVQVDGEWRRVTETLATHAIADGTCPHCASPLRIRGTDPRISADDRAYESDAHCIDCHAQLGIVRADMETMFGLHEDEAVVAEVTRGSGTMGRVY